MGQIYCKIESTNTYVISLFTTLINNNKTTNDHSLQMDLMAFPRVDTTSRVGDVIIYLIESDEWYISFAISNTGISSKDLYNWIIGCGYEVTVDIVNDRQNTESDALSIDSEHVAIIELALAN